jgi:hypothetical protein
MFRKQVLRLMAAGFIVLISVSAGVAQTASTPAQAPPVPRLEIYGFVMTDTGFDFNNNDPDWFDVVRPTKLEAFENEFGRDGKTYAGVRQTRFGVKGYENTPLGELKTHFEFDMFGVGPDAGQTTIRPRFFYGEIGAFGAGQTESPFMDIDVFPNILEYWGPNGMVFFRNVQVRWMPLRGDTRLTIALERPGSTQDPGVLAQRIEIQNILARYPYPDLSGAFRYGKKRGYIRAGGIVRKIMLDDLLKDDPLHLDDGVIGWGVNVSSNVKFNAETLRLQYVYGDGIENYMNDAPVDIAARPNFGDPIRPIRARALPMQSLVAFLDHSWNKNWTTSAGYSQLVISNTTLQLPSEFHRGQYAIVNLLHSPAEHILYGAEAQWARRTNFGDGFHANDYRIQFSFKFNFSAQIGGSK